LKSSRVLSITLFFIFIIKLYCTAKTNEIEQIEYQVYKAVIEQEYLSQPGFIDMINKKDNKLLPKTIIIINQTISGPKFGMPEEQVFNKIGNDYPSFPQEAMNCWAINNKSQYKLNDEFRFITKHCLISEEQRKEAFLPSKWWDSFYKHYPNALGYFRLSRVGFDTIKKAAIVYIENSQDGKWGSGNFWLLKNENGKWVCFGKVTVYLS
jgi:hypothetical protein